MMRRLAGLSLAGLLLTGCSLLDGGIFGEKEKEKLTGERISVMSADRTLEPDARIADLQVRLPRPYVNDDWPQSGGYPSHAMHHLSLGTVPRVAWRVNIGSGTDRDYRLPSPPVVGDGRLYAIDSKSRVSAYGLDDGRRVWGVDLTPKGAGSGALGGGIAYDSGKLYVATGYGEVVALEAASGRPLWKHTLAAPARVPPSVEAGRVMVISHDNLLTTLDGETGVVAWTYTSVTEGAGILGAGNPAAEEGFVIAPFASGDLVALRTDTGRVAWSDSLIRTTRVSSIATINDIAAAPVIDRGRVYAVGHAGRMVALDIRSGDRIWEQSIGGVQQPWIAGDFIFVLTLDGDLACLSRRDGRIRWVTGLERWENPKQKKDPIVWFGPVLASDRLIVVSNRGRALSLSPYTGDILGAIPLADRASRPPIVAEGMLFILTDDASIVAMK